MRLYGHDNNWLTTAENGQETPQIASLPWHEHQIEWDHCWHTQQPGLALLTEIAEKNHSAILLSYYLVW